MRKSLPSWIFFYALIMIVFLRICDPALATGDSPLRKVLILNSYHPGMSFSDEEMRGIRSTLPNSTEVFIEYLDAKRISHPEYLNYLRQIYALKYAGTRFDLIFSLDDDALRFLIQHHEQLFPDTPVVFCGVNNLPDATLQRHPWFTGVIESIDIEASINLALQLLPQTRQVLVVTDNTTTGIINRAILEKLSKDGRTAAKFIFMDSGEGLLLSELLQKIKAGPANSIVYYSDFFQDRAGNAQSLETVMPQLSAISPGPIFVHGAIYLGYGALGGKLNSGFYQGKTAVDLAQRIWRGEKPAVIPIEGKNINRFMFDAKELQRWEIPLSELPAGSDILNQKISFYEQYRLYIWGIVGFLIAEACIIVLLVINIHRRRQAEIELLESKDLLESVIENIPLMIFLKEPTDQRFVLFNLAGEELLGYDRKFLLGKNDLDLFPPEQASYFMAKDREVLDGGTGVLDIPEEAILTVKKGTRLLHTKKLCIKGPDGTAKFLLGISEDITERKRAEEELRESEQKWRVIFDGSPVGIMLMNQQTVVLECNQHIADIFGVEREKYIGLNIMQTLPHGIIRQGLSEARNDDEIHYYEGPYTSILSGKDLYINITTERIAPDLIIAIIVDVTEKRESAQAQEKLQEQLHQAQKMESVALLAGGVAHDFNNMLGVILGHTELALNRLDPSDPFYPGLQNIRKAAQRSADLTRQLLAFARKQIIAPKTLDLNEAIEGLLGMLERLIGEDIDLAWLPCESLGAIKMDPSQIDQILINLCVNARDAIGDTGKIIIETHNAVFDEGYCAAHTGFIPGEYVLLVASDNGCGMDSETISHLFEPFFTTKGMGKGTGLGLSTVYGIVKQNGGFINVDSEPDMGTTFKVYLPLDATKAEPAEKIDVVKLARRGHETILLVEDEPLILDMTKEMLEHHGYTVLAVATPGEAIRLSREHAGQIHLIITDVVMPEMNGRDLARNLLSLSPNLKRLFMSGYTANVIAHHGVLDEGVHFIQKPFSLNDLAEKVREVFEG